MSATSSISKDSKKTLRSRKTNSIEETSPDDVYDSDFEKESDFNDDESVEDEDSGNEENSKSKNESEIGSSDSGSGSDSDIEEIEDMNEGEQIVKDIIEEFEQMKMKICQDQHKNTIEAQYTAQTKIRSMKSLGSSSDTNYDENAKNTFEVEVCIENHRSNTFEESNDDDDNDKVEEQNDQEEEVEEEEEVDGLDENGENETESEPEHDQSDDNENEVHMDAISTKSNNFNSDTIANKDETSLVKYETPKEEKHEESSALEKYSRKESQTESEEEETSVELEVSSKRPSSFNSDEYAFHLNFIDRPPSYSDTRLNKFKNANKNLSFSNERMREIERHNRILLQKILAKKPTNNKKTATNTTNQKNQRNTSAAINRRKQQRQIDLDNQVLKRKLEAIALRRPHR